VPTLDPSVAPTLLPSAIEALASARPTLVRAPCGRCMHARMHGSLLLPLERLRLARLHGPAGA
jgi:hypothetical protein